jgi:hypothetical protein
LVYISASRPSRDDEALLRALAGTHALNPTVQYPQVSFLEKVRAWPLQPVEDQVDWTPYAGLFSGSE